MDATIHRQMHQIFEAVTDLEPLSPTATPGMKTNFQNTTDALKNYSDLMQCHLSGIREASGLVDLDDRIQWDEPEGPLIHAKAKIVCIFFSMVLNSLSLNNYIL